VSTFDLSRLTPDRKRALLARLLEEQAGGEVTVSPLSYGQRALWLVHQLEPQSAAYNVAIAARIPVGLDTAALRRSLQTLVDRHAALRTTVMAWDGRPLQRIRRHAPVSLREVDATTWDDERLHATLRSEAHRPFDLAQGPLLRTLLLRRPGDEHVFLLAVHHIVFDVVSLVVILDELDAAYSAVSAGREPTLRPRGAEYADYVRWQARHLAGPEGERQWQYWRGKLAPPLSLLDLPLDRPRPPVATVSGADLAFGVAEDLTAAIKSLAREQGTTLYTVLLAAFGVLLHRYCGQSDIVVGSPFVGRSMAEFTGTIGYFINPVVLRNDCSADPPFTEFLAQVRRTVLEALEHQDYPFSLLVERLHPERDPSRSPLFQVMFNMPKANRLEEQSLAQFMLGTADAQMDLGGLQIELFPVEQRVAMFDLLLGMVDAGRSISASMQYNTDLFDRSTIERMVDHFHALLAALSADPKRRLSELELHTGQERTRLVASGVPADRNPESGWVGVVELFEAQVRRQPAATAVSADAARLTYAELDVRATAVATVVADHGLGPDDIVAVLADRGIDLLAALIGILKAGPAYLPVDPRDPPARIARILRESRPSLVLAGDELAARSAEPGTAGVFAPARPGDLAYVIYTSGSTGVPKGAMIEHRGLVNHLHAKIEDLALTTRDVVAQTASQCFDISVWQFLAPLAAGGRVHIVPDEIAHDPARLLAEATESGTTVLETVPSMLAAMLAELSRRSSAAPVLPSLRWMVSTGEELWPNLCRDWLDRFPTVPIVNAYGPTECSDDVTHHVVRERPGPGAARVPVGRPILGTRIHVLDPAMRPVPEPAVGELYVSGPGVGRGYLRDPRRTAEAFLPDPFGAPGDRLYRTGDLARYRVDGEIELLGRIDRQVKVRGNRIELGEIEATLAGHPAVQEAVVVVHGTTPDAHQLIGYVVPATTADPDPPQLDVTELLRWTRTRLPAVMVPPTVVTVPRIPRTPNGKVDRRALPAPQPRTTPDGDTSGEALSATEVLVAALWCEVLDRDRVGRRDNFFDLGGHSLQATQILSRLREARQTDLPLRAFIQDPTVAGIAGALDEYSRRPATDTHLDGVPVARLAPDGRLDDDIVPVGDRAPRTPGVVLVTGATGFLGAHLVDALRTATPADVVCVVRATDDAAAHDRLRDALRAHRLTLEGLGDRIRAVAGDLAQPRLGLGTGAYDTLAAGVDAIVHAGAEVNFIRPYATLKAANVSGTREILRLACLVRTVPVHLVSTVAVLGSGNGRGRVYEDDPLDGVGQLHDGYTQSKWVAEALAAAASARGVPVSVYRPGHITGQSLTGVGPQVDLTLTLLDLSINLGLAPDLDIPVDMTPVDYVSQAIVRLAQKEWSGPPAHLANPVPARLPEVIGWIRSFGYQVETVSTARWLREVASALGHGDATAALLAQHLHPDMVPEIDSEQTQARLRASGIACPPVDERLVHTYLDHWRAGNLLPPLGNR